MKLKSLLIIFLIFSSCITENKTPIEEQVKNQAKLIKSSKEYSDMAIKVMNLADEGIVEQNKVDAYKELIKKATKDAKKVDTDLLNEIRNGYGKVFSEKYIKGLELQLDGYENGNSKNLAKGQILYDEYVDWVNENIN